MVEDTYFPVSKTVQDQADDLRDLLQVLEVETLLDFINLRRTHQYYWLCVAIWQLRGVFIFEQLNDLVQIHLNYK